MAVKKIDGYKIVLTASATEMSGFYDSQFLAFLGGFSKGPVPSWLFRKRLYPPVDNNDDGTARYAPYGLRKVEAALLESGFDESDVAVVHPDYLSSFIGPNTKAVGITTMDPLGMGYVSKTYSSLVAEGEPLNAIEFTKLIKSRALQTYHPKIIVGGAGAWQLEQKNAKPYDIDSIVIGGSEKTIAELFAKASNGEDLSQVVHAEENPVNGKISSIKHASIHGCVEISRGCGRNCQFCTPTMQRRRDLPLDMILKEVETNVKEGTGRVTLVTEDIFMYGAKNDGFIPNREAVLGLLGNVASYPGVKAVQPAHMSLAPVVYDPGMVRAASEILINRNWYGIHGKPIVTAETGIETGSPRLIQKYMAGKSLPFKPEGWTELVSQAFGILNDNNWYPLATLIIGLPDETEDDVLKTIELIDDLNKYNAFFVPLLFVPLEKCLLEDQCGAELNALSKLRWELLSDCWEYNVRIWKSSFLEYRINNPLLHFGIVDLLLPSIGLFAGLHYWRKHGKIARDLVWNAAGVS